MGCPTNEYSREAVGMLPLHWAATEGRLRASAWLLGAGGASREGRDNQVSILGDEKTSHSFLVKCGGGVAENLAFEDDPWRSYGISWQDFC